MKTKRKLELLVKKLGSQAAVACVMGTYQPTVNDWLSERRRIQPIAAALIDLLYDLRVRGVVPK